MQGTQTPEIISSFDASKLGAQSVFIDVRTASEFDEVHINGALHHPLSDLDSAKIRELLSGKSGAILVCRSGGRARQACEKLLAAGISNVKILEGGVTAWAASGLPVVRGRKTISLERQVRIAAGSLVLIGALLGYFVSPVCIALCAFIGAGLMFSGITDTCGMAMALARMPWNTRSSNVSSSCALPSGK
jgi:rhodanese-related sulfurtransferase